jgi:2-keto-4-pentenoate hydratase/2-oxohepta-3-ene-1,7-dioic acid hydratase in catechol pathway
MVFTKFPSSIGRPETTVNLPGPTTDWEAELVVVIGHTVRSLSLATALESVAGYMVGQDYSERTVQMSNTPAQFSLGKSFENFTIAGPYLTTVDEIPDPQKLTINCAVNGELMQSETTQDMAFSIAEILVYISSVCELRAGDLIFTGSPAGVGQGQIPPRFLVGGDEVTTSISGLGSISNRFIGDAR